MEKIRAHLIISGRVQGVYFRYSTQEAALRLGLTGWVRNLPNRDVEAVIEGEPDTVEKMVAWCHQGPPASRVDNVSDERSPATGEFARFDIR